jgi:glycosyltransferase involved in cell wall biosynthesis
MDELVEEPLKSGVSLTAGILIFCGFYQPPFDEGLKLFVHNLRQQMEQLTSVLMVTTMPGASKDTIVIRKQPWYFLRDIRRLCKKFQPEVILYVPDASLNKLSLARCGLFRLAAGSAPIGMITLQPNSFDMLVRMMLRLWKPDMLFAQAAPSKQVPYERYGIRYQLLPPAVDTERFLTVKGNVEKQHLLRKYSLPQYSKICLHVGHIRQSRNMNWLLRLKLPAEAHLVVVSSTSRFVEKGLKSALQERGATVLNSYLPAIEEIYQLADVYLFPVQAADAAIEMPLSILEAMACNLSVVTTSFGGLTKYFTNVAGLYFADTPEGFQRAVSKALKAHICKTRAAVQLFSWQNIAKILYKNLRK